MEALAWGGEGLWWGRGRRRWMDVVVVGVGERKREMDGWMGEGEGEWSESEMDGWEWKGEGSEMDGREWVRERGRGVRVMDGIGRVG
ncbi:hypothetical protein Pmani_026174 [Petrolisthes manimaculis]|uniref:Uncharacterized protein n=1 Tax=Petrolisthes manimaculis TaxID=1843537 RepID=A0AAE1P3Z4_9EUCA|nr:hypothetical protein Pmani_026174 [Petrolisthes manimaculis]